MPDYIDVIVTGGNLKTMYARIKHFLGADFSCDDEGNLNTRVEEAVALGCMTPATEGIDGKWRFAVQMSEEQADKLPKNDTPNFTLDRSDDVGFVWHSECVRFA